MGDVGEDEGAGEVATDDQLERSWAGPDNELPEALDLAGDLDGDHAPEPGALQEIGTCRRCGLLIARNTQGVWSHRPSVGELDAGRTWLGRNEANPVL